MGCSLLLIQLNIFQRRSELLYKDGTILILVIVKSHDDIILLKGLKLKFLPKVFLVYFDQMVQEKVLR